MSPNESQAELQKRVQALEIQLNEAKGKLQDSGIELEASEGLMRLMNDDMRRIYQDLLKSQSQLMQSDKLATIGLLTAGIVHEINNPLAAVNLAFSLMENQVQKFNKMQEALGSAAPAEMQTLLEDYAEYVGQGKLCVETMARIVSDIRMFSRSDKGLKNEENMNNIVDSVLSIVANSLKNRVTIKKEPGDIPKIKCNAQQLSQVFLNLIVNASQAMEGRPGAITVKTSYADKRVVVEISDKGCGMTKEVMERIFEPFFTTKGAEQGTGLGLSITHDIVKKHQGEISVASEVGKGTTFKISLPA